MVFLGNCFIGLLLIAIGFWVGTQPNPTLGLLGFLCFFVIGVTVIAEGWKNRNSNQASK